MAAALAGSRTRPLKEEEQNLFAAMRLRAVNHVPYLATALFRLTPVSAPGLGTMATDPHWRVYIDFNRVAQWGVDAATGLFVHEVSHPLRDHYVRAKETAAQPDRWNISADCEINDDLRQMGMTLPPEAWFPEGLTSANGKPAPEGRTSEFYYPLVPEAPVGQGEPDEVQGGRGGAADGGGQPRGGHRGRPVNRGAATGVCGSGAGGRPADIELPAHDSRFPSVSPAQGELVRRKVAEDTRDYERSKGRGSVPAGMSRWAAEVLAPPKVSWQQVLRSAVRQAMITVAGNIDYTYSRSSRRESGPFIFPGMQKPRVTVGTVVDTSGSMSSRDLAAALAEVEGIVRKAGIRGRDHRLLTVDASAGEPQVVTSARKIKLTGGGGTDMRVGINAVERLTPRPDVTIVFTDGFTPWPVTRTTRSTPLIVGIIGSEASIADAEATWGPPPWARVVRIPTAK
jgi:predicted metal-dependent peptidase